MCMCLARDGMGEKGVESIRELGLGFTNSVGTGECMTCVCVLVAVVLCSRVN